MIALFTGAVIVLSVVSVVLNKAADRMENEAESMAHYRRVEFRQA